VYMHEKESRDGCYLERIKERRMKEGMQMRWGKDLRDENYYCSNFCMEEE
jgi:hypothetical protein